MIIILLSIYILYRSTNIFVIIRGNPTAVISKFKTSGTKKNHWPPYFINIVLAQGGGIGISVYLI